MNLTIRQVLNAPSLLLDIQLIDLILSCLFIGIFIGIILLIITMLKK